MGVYGGGSFGGCAERGGGENVSLLLLYALVKIEQGGRGWFRMRRRDFRFVKRKGEVYT